MAGVVGGESAASCVRRFLDTCDVPVTDKLVGYLVEEMGISKLEDLQLVTAEDLQEAKTGGIHYEPVKYIDTYIHTYICTHMHMLKVSWDEIQLQDVFQNV